MRHSCSVPSPAAHLQGSRKVKRSRRWAELGVWLPLQDWSQTQPCSSRSPQAGSGGSPGFTRA